MREKNAGEVAFYQLWAFRPTAAKVVDAELYEPQGKC